MLFTLINSLVEKCKAHLNIHRKCAIIFDHDLAEKYVSWGTKRHAKLVVSGCLHSC